MGDRCAFGFRETSERKEETVWLYSHWGGSDRFKDLSNALVKAGSRWNDPSYATRIAISQIIGDNWNSEYGFGIYTGEQYTGDNEYEEVLVVNWKERTVTGVWLDGSEVVEYGFAAFLSMFGDRLTLDLERLFTPAELA